MHPSFDSIVLAGALAVGGDHDIEARLSVYGPSVWPGDRGIGLPTTGGKAVLASALQHVAAVLERFARFLTTI